MRKILLHNQIHEIGREKAREIYCKVDKRQVHIILEITNGKKILIKSDKAIPSNIKKFTLHASLLNQAMIIFRDGMNANNLNLDFLLDSLE